MKRLAAIAAVLLVLGVAGSAMAQEPYAWTLSYSDTDPYVQQDDATTGLVTIYLWYVIAPDPPLRMASADLTLETSGTYTLLAANPHPGSGYLNAGTLPNLLLAVGGCPAPPLIAMDILVTDVDGGSLCFVGDKLTVDCTVNDIYNSDWLGCNSQGITPCGTLAVEEETWGGIKALYR